MGGDIECLNQLVGHAVLFGQVKRTRSPGQLDCVVSVVDRFKAAAAIFALDEPRDPFVDHELAEPLRDQVHKLFALQDAQGVVGIHDRLFRAG